MSNKSIPQHYLETGILGAYETVDILPTEVSDGKYLPTFDDALLICDEQQTVLKRSMIIEGRRFNITSVFSSNSKITPTDKLLAVIDNDLECD